MGSYESHAGKTNRTDVKTDVGRQDWDASTVISEKSKTIKYIKSILVNVCAYKSKKWHWAVDESMRKDMWEDLLSNLKIVTRKDVNRIH